MPSKVTPLSLVFSTALYIGRGCLKNTKGALSGMTTKFTGPAQRRRPESEQVYAPTPVQPLDAPTRGNGQPSSSVQTNH